MGFCDGKNLPNELKEKKLLKDSNTQSSPLQIPWTYSKQKKSEKKLIIHRIKRSSIRILSNYKIKWPKISIQGKRFALTKQNKSVHNQSSS